MKFPIFPISIRFLSVCWLNSFRISFFGLFVFTVDFLFFLHLIWYWEWDWDWPIWFDGTERNFFLYFFFFEFFIASVNFQFGNFLCFSFTFSSSSQRKEKSLRILFCLFLKDFFFTKFFFAIFSYSHKSPPSPILFSTNLLNNLNLNLNFHTKYFSSIEKR